MGIIDPTFLSNGNPKSIMLKHYFALMHIFFYYEVFLRNKRILLDKERDPETCYSDIGLLPVSSTLSIFD